MGNFVFSVHYWLWLLIISAIFHMPEDNSLQYFSGVLIFKQIFRLHVCPLQNVSPEVLLIAQLMNMKTITFSHSATAEQLKQLPSVILDSTRKPWSGLHMRTTHLRLPKSVVCKMKAWDWWTLDFALFGLEWTILKCVWWFYHRK